MQKVSVGDGKSGRGFLSGRLGPAWRDDDATV